MIQLLDHGFLRIVEAWGMGDNMGDNEVEFPDFESGIIEAARQSTQGSFRGWEKDRKLLKFLYDNKHSSPFEFAGLVIEVQAPLFVFREWHRHRTQSYNEMSARYEPLPELYYIPTIETLMVGVDGTNKQAGRAEGASPLTLEEAQIFQDYEIYNSKSWEAHYRYSLSKGVRKETARNSMPVNHYSRMRAAMNLKNALGFLTLRQDPKAQYEIRVYADALAAEMTKVFPETMKLYAGS